MKIKDRRYDIHIQDRHVDTDKFATIDSTVNLTREQVMDFVFSGGDWNFMVVRHGEQAFISNGDGTCTMTEWLVFDGYTGGDHCDHIWEFNKVSDPIFEHCTECESTRRFR